MTRRALLALSLLIAWTTVGVAQVEQGRPFVREYKPLEIGGGGQIWDIAQDPRGVMYFAIDGGILEFDCGGWRTIRTPNGGVVRSLAFDAAGRLWVGGYNLFGSLAPHASGELRLVPVSDKVPAPARIADVWRTLVTDPVLPDVLNDRQALLHPGRNPWCPFHRPSP